jgi:hypothetical protein
MSESKVSQYEKEVDLPSRGLFYAGKMPGGRVTIKPISVMEEKYLVAARNRLAAADKILERCIIGACVTLPQMLMTDKFYLLLNLRAITYGPTYGFKLECKSCGAEFKHSIELPQGLVVRSATDQAVEPFDVKLPFSGDTVSLRFLRGYDETEIEAYGRQLPATKEDEGDVTYAYRLSRHIVKINGEELDPVQRLSYIESAHGGDSLAIRSALDDRQTGADLELTATCTVASCRKTNTYQLPFTAEFFPSRLA